MGVLAEVPGSDGLDDERRTDRVPSRQLPPGRLRLARGIERPIPISSSPGHRDVGGRRSDTIMILRQERNGGAAADQPAARPLGRDRRHRQEAADQLRVQRGPERLAATVTQSLGIPIHHYVEVDFLGFKQIIDDLGGVEICVDTRPVTPTAGCTSMQDVRPSTV